MIANSKFEARNSKQYLITKIQILHKRFDIRIWNLFRISDFGFRILQCLLLGFLILSFNSFTFGSTAGFSSLQIIPSARECAMGGTGVISSFGPQSMYFNPALTSNLSSFAINLNYSKWFLDMYEQSLFLVRPFSHFNLGLGIVNFNAGQLDFRPDYPTDEPIANFNPADFNFLINFSKKTDAEKFQTSFGISGRYYYQKIYEHTATGVGLDFGTTINLPANFKVGVAIKDFGTKMEFIRKEFSLPTRALAGMIYNIRLSKVELISSLDITYLFNDKELNVNGGLEVCYLDRYFLRGGYKTNNTTNNYNVGFGILVRNIRIEYALSPNNLNIGNTHHISIGVGY